ncbi:hybrid-cluster NAD(P)-dependent oxidoreductase [Corticibacterium sp. UT-5YL-CI-8]|nr:hybrid-cluster NAD(P)-dependent oxidoreductase [Tianweitania sp. UT-5YL-CI-8]
MDTRTLSRMLEDARTTRFWNPETDDTLVCLDVHQETHDVKTFTFASPDGKLFNFKAGQYFLFNFSFGLEEESRCYSISSSPQRTSTFSITVKRVVGGRISNWMHDNFSQGSQIKAQGPLGSFIRPTALDKKFLLLSGGSGITPVMSMVRELADTCEQADVIFVHAARAPKDLIFRDELTCLAGRIKQLRLHFLPEYLTGEPAWPGLSGRISPGFLKLAVPDMSERIVMCCGPTPFMSAARTITADAGVPPSHYIEESFDAAILDITPSIEAEAIRTTLFAVEFAKQARKIDVSSEQTVLSSAKKAGVRIPSSCANGVCGTCKSKLVSGAVDMKHNGGIRQREIDAGFFLPCCSKPVSNLVVDR